MSNNFTSHFSADDATLVPIDFQPQMFLGVESHDRNAIKNNLQLPGRPFLANPARSIRE